MCLHSALYDLALARTEGACLRSWRRELLAGLKGDVLEIGAGTGANLDCYPPGLRSLTLSEPQAAMRARLSARVGARTGLPPTVLPHAAEALPLPDASVDAVVCTLVLCSVPDPAATLAAVRRVLRPGGRLLFLEHVAADDPATLAWQRRLQPAWGWVAGGCQLARHTEGALGEAGFAVEAITREPMRQAPFFVRPAIRGVARL